MTKLIGLDYMQMYPVLRLTLNLSSDSSCLETNNRNDMNQSEPKAALSQIYITVLGGQSTTDTVPEL